MHVRAFGKQDREAVDRLTPRLRIGAPDWADPAAVLEALHRWVRESMDEGTVFVVEDGGAVIGFVTVKERPHFTGIREGYVGELVVAEEAERRGAGRALMAAVEDWAREQGLARVSLDTGASNVAARDFYAALGYEETDVRLSKPVT
jgi:ribosomal protein S18 acetylase RimI-like enzyme